MRKIFHLSSCSTCRRIIQELHEGAGFELQDIKSQPLTEAELAFLKEQTGSYESLFSRRAIKYKTMGLKDKKLSEEDYKNLILQEYTFLQRPVIVIEEKVFVGNAKKNIEMAKNHLLSR